MTLPRTRSRDSQPELPGPASRAGAGASARPDNALPAHAGVGAVHVVTFGCQMNKYDSELVEGRFRQRGWSTTDDPARADLILFNTCSVREHAEERVFSWLGELKRARERRPDLVVGVMGCMAQRVEEEIFRRAGHVDLVVGTRAFQRLPDLIEEVRLRRRQGAPDARRVALEMDGRPDEARTGQTWSGGRDGYLAVMRGCDLHCTFCIVPSVRGRVLSRPPADVVAEARWMVQQGARTITLLGQTVNSYGEDLEPVSGHEPGRGRGGRPSLADLLYALQEIEGLARVRLITLHPSYVSAALARAIADCDKVERFLPLPVQSGSDEVLRRMKRGYTTDLYRARAALLRDAVPDIELGTDWIVGFPGESAEDFERSEAFLSEQGFVVNYVFQYDPRPTTKAAAFADDVPGADKRARNQRLLRAGEASALRRMRAHLGRTLDVLIEAVDERRPGRLRGRSRHGLPVSLEGPPQWVGSERRVIAEDASPYGLSGRAEGAA